MKTPDPDEQKNWIPGSDYLAVELANRFSVPKDEITTFLPFIRVYTRGSVLIQEEELDKSLFLLRAGTLEVYKNAAGRQTGLGTVEAVNFVGEMSLINDERRSATIKALSDQVLVYCFVKPNLSLILSNPKWAELLISRFAKNLATSNNQLAEMRQKLEWQKEEAAKLQAELDRHKSLSAQILKKTELVLNSILRFQATTRDRAVVGSKGWGYLMALSQLSLALIKHYLPETRVPHGDVEKPVMQQCLAEVRKNNPTGVFDDFDV